MESNDPAEGRKESPPTPPPPVFEFCRPKANRQNSAPIVEQPRVDHSISGQQNVMSSSSSSDEMSKKSENIRSSHRLPRSLHRSPSSRRVSKSPSRSSRNIRKSPSGHRSHTSRNDMGEIIEMAQMNRRSQMDQLTPRSPRSPNAIDRLQLPDNPPRKTGYTEAVHKFHSSIGDMPASPTGDSQVVSSPRRPVRPGRPVLIRQQALIHSSYHDIPALETETSFESNTSTSHRSRTSTSDLTERNRESYVIEDAARSRSESPRTRKSDRRIPDRNRSMPPPPERNNNTRNEGDLYRLRTFSISKGNVINTGDSIIDRRTRNVISVGDTGHGGIPVTAGRGAARGAARDTTGIRYSAGGRHLLSRNIDSAVQTSSRQDSPYLVFFCGEPAVGKTSLASQFMTSEYVNTYAASLDEESGMKPVSVLLDGQVSELIFIDEPYSDPEGERSLEQLKRCLATYDLHACIVVYSINDVHSFAFAECVLDYLSSINFIPNKPVILVGNKSDLERSRTISTAAGRALATSRNVKFIETSSGIQHNVDELLVGILKQCRLRESLNQQDDNDRGLLRRVRETMSFNAARNFFSRLCCNDWLSRSCMDLHAL